jgi:hypothetical protein
MRGGTRLSSAVSRRAAGLGGLADVLLIGVFLILAIAALTVFGSHLAEAGAALSTRVLQIYRQ